MHLLEVNSFDIFICSLDHFEDFIVVLAGKENVDFIEFFVDFSFSIE